MNIDIDAPAALAEIADALKIKKQSVAERALKEVWPYTEKSGRGGKRRFFELADLPENISRSVQSLRDLKNYEQSPEYQVGRVISEQIAAKSAKKAEEKAQDAEAMLALFAQATGEKGERGRAWLATYNAWQRFYKEKFGDKPRSVNKALNAFVAGFNERTLGMNEAVVEVILQSSGRGKSAKQKGLSLRTLQRKLELVKESGIGALLDNHHGANKGESVIHRQPSLEHYVLGALAHSPDIKPGILRELALVHFADREIKIPSDTAFERYLRAWKARNASAFLYMQNPDAWKNKAMPGVGDADGGVERLNQLWELDSTPGDLLLSDGKRHAIVGVIDVYSRRMKLLVTPTSRARAIGALMRRALLDWGVPEQAKTDNGADYTSDYLSGLLASLMIEHVLCPPFSPEYKPHIERGLGTFNHDLVELQPGYIGHDVAQRKAIEARRSFASRLMEKDAVLEVRLSPEELQKFCDDWVENRYHHRPHAGLDGETPFQHAASYTGDIKRIGNERALDILLSPPVDGKTRSLGKKGLEINGGFYSHAELWRNHTTGDAFRVALDETDLGRVYVYDEDGFVCVAICPQRLGMAPEDIRRHAMECKRMANEQRKQGVKKMRKAKEGVNLNEQINGFLQAKAEEAGKLTPFPQPSKTHSSAALDGAAKAADEMDSPPRSPEAEKLTAEARAHFAAQRPTAEIIQLPPPSC